VSLRAGFVARRGFFLVSAVVFALDQVTKVSADLWLRDRPPVTILPGAFSLVYSRNRGGLFGYFSTLDDPWRIVLLTIFPMAAIVVIALFLAKTDEPDRSTLFGLALILGGATGNLLDRIVRGEVVDFLDAYVSWAPLENWQIETFRTAHWPTFNIADSAIVVGACLLVLDILRPASPAGDTPERTVSSR
jgi:signal peptidase II